MITKKKKEILAEFEKKIRGKFLSENDVLIILEQILNSLVENEPKSRYDIYGLKIREGADREIAVEVGGEFMSWAINHQDRSKYVGEVMCGAWFEWLDRKEDD